MKFEDLNNMCNLGMSAGDISLSTGVSKTTVRYWLNKHGLSTRFNRVHKCLECDTDEADNFSAGKYSICKKCRNQQRYEKAKANRAYALNKLGGKCVACGFDKFPCSLDIHHTDPSIKDENFESIRSWSLEKIDHEISSCVLLCKNCHSAFHAGYITLPV